MRTLPLYVEPPQAAIGTAEPSAIDQGCTRCVLHEKARSRCIQPEGDPGGVLFVADMPTKVEDATGRPFSGPAGKYLRGLVRKLGWQGPVAYDHAVRCAPGATPVKEKHVDACRTYGAQIAHDARPTRIICLGPLAMEAVMGHRAPVASIRRGYGWFFNALDEAIPVFFLGSPGLALRNRFQKEAFEDDLRWALTCEDPKINFGGSVHVIESEFDARRAEKELLKHDWLSYDCETFGLMHNKDFRLESVTVFGAESDDGYCWSRDALKDSGARKILKRVLEARPQATQNGKYDDRAVLLDLGAKPDKILIDTRLVRKLDDPEAKASLDVLSFLVGMGGHKREAEAALDQICSELKYQANPPTGLTPTGKPRKVRPPKFHVPPAVLKQIADGADVMAFAFGFLDDETLERYNARDVKSTRDNAKLMLAQLEKDKMLRHVWNTVTADANRAVRWIEYWGFGIDKAAVGAFAKYCKQKVQDGETKLFAHAPGINHRSPQQLAKFLFDELKLPVVELTDSGARGTGKAVLEELQGKHSAVDAILQIRKYDKLDTFYATGMQPHIRQDGRVHSSFLLDGAGSGRLSSQEPNMQNLPRAKGSPDAKMARDCFVAAPGYVLLEADFSQLELRIAADLSNDPVMIDDFRKGIDIHMNAARECAPFVWKITHAKWDAMTKDERDPYRSKIKSAVFGKLYGKTERGLAIQLDCTLAEVQKINSVIWGRYKILDKWCKQVISETKKTGVAVTWFGGDWARRRPLWKIADIDEDVRRHGENAAVNTPVQGSAADHCTASLWPLVQWILEDAVPAKVVCTVHDSIVQEVREDCVEEVARMTVKIMTSHKTKNGVPIKVDLKTGYSYGSMSDYHLPS